MSDEQHVMRALGVLMDQAREQVLGDDQIGLRPSQLRVIAMVSPGGSTVTELAARVGMTKQGTGQFVATLVAGGYLTAEPDPRDRRVRMVHQTRRGRSASKQLTHILADLERRWAERVGSADYHHFRTVLDRLVENPES